MTLQKWVTVLGAGLVLVFVLAIMGLTRPVQKTIVDSNQVDVQGIARTVYDAVVANLGDKFGASSAPAENNGCVEIGGVITCYRSSALLTGTTTTCVLPSPSATSTLARATLRIGVGSSTASTWFANKGTTRFASSTLLGQFSVGSGVQATLVVASTTADTTIVAGSVNDIASMVFAPNTWVVWSTAGYAPNDTTKFTGRCQATFQQI